MQLNNFVIMAILYGVLSILEHGIVEGVVGKRHRLNVNIECSTGVPNRRHNPN